MSTVLIPYYLADELGNYIVTDLNELLLVEADELRVGRTGQLYGAIRNRILTYDPVGRLHVDQLLTGGLYTLEAPDKATYPFGVIRLTARGTGAGDDGRLRERGRLQIVVYGRPRADLDRLETAMDVIENALYGWSDDVEGLLTIRSLSIRDTAPPYQSPENREIIHVRGVWEYTYWPTYRTHLAVASGDPAPNSP
jgi:hypothetical protein